MDQTKRKTDKTSKHFFPETSETHNNFYQNVCAMCKTQNR